METKGREATDKVEREGGNDKGRREGDKRVRNRREREDRGAGKRAWNREGDGGRRQILILPSREGILR